MKDYSLVDYVEMTSEKENVIILKVKDSEDSKDALIANGFWGTETTFRIERHPTKEGKTYCTFEAFTSDCSYPKFINNDLKKEALNEALLAILVMSALSNIETEVAKKADQKPTEAKTDKKEKSSDK